MTEYIEKATVLNLLKKINPVDFGSIFDYEAHGAVQECLREISYRVEDMPTADVEEVRHGRWIVHFDHFTPYQKCSVCGFEIPLVVATENEAEICLYKHCPECIARMDKEAEHETD